MVLIKPKQQAICSTGPTMCGVYKMYFKKSLWIT